MDFPTPPPREAITNPKLLEGFDERISLDKVTNLWVFDSGKEEYEYNYEQVRWDKRKRQVDDVDLEEEEEANKREIKKLKKERMAKLKEEISRLKQEKHQKQLDEQSSSAVFVSGLPSDCTKDDIQETFSKYGILSEDFTTGEPRIKLYHDDEGTFKGEALVFYEKSDSVFMAIDMLDDTQFKPGVVIKVEQAKFGEKKSNPLTDEQKKLLKQKKEQLKAKLNNWDEDDKLKEERFHNTKRKILDKIVVVDQMFRVDELKQDPVLEMDLKEDIQEECDKLGIGNDITKITLLEDSGKVTIKFKLIELSEICIKGFNGRYFDGIKLNAHVFDEKGI